MGEVIKLMREGSPQQLCANLVEIADDIDYMLVIRVMKDKKIGTDWSKIENSLAAMGAVGCLYSTVMEWYE